MYYLFGALILICILLSVLTIFRKRKIGRKICSMPVQDKCRLLNDIIKPFGYKYDLCSDTFSTTLDAWQKKFGYITLYDKAASRFSMVFDCAPIYFYYNEKTWLLELWKGQYGINTGAEIGIYSAGGIIPSDRFSKTVFYAADGDEMLDFAFKISKNGKPLMSAGERHWWCTGFLMGIFSVPKTLSLDVCIGFRQNDMLYAFAESLKKTEIHVLEINANKGYVCLRFEGAHPPKKGCLAGLIRWWSQLKNRLFCKLFLFVTWPYCSSLDRLLYLYFFLPPAARKTMRIHSFKKYGAGKKASGGQK